MKCGAFSKSFEYFISGCTVCFFFDFFLVSVATVSVLGISRGKMISNPKENSSDFWRAGIFVF